MPGTSALHLRCPRRPSEGTWRERLQVSTEQSQDQLRLVQSTLRPRAECSGTVPSLQTNARPTWTRGCPSRPWSSPLPASPVALCGQLSNKTETGTVGEITLSQGGFCSQAAAASAESKQDGVAWPSRGPTGGSCGVDGAGNKQRGREGAVLLKEDPGRNTAWCRGQHAEGERQQQTLE
ncbi:PREDICTED: uncharacterized protein LOC108445713 isoform X3 [Corvus brachyrhynchos]|uniref:uncharacterized protein LOC108445713 isoform X3 n=1 Tax=Corvus brachyrhynchos TaxID=85066 RepID=UPI0008167DFD|nr:PREDICTED: uncharacterized protein LOC108445713 isoform X3 [Corvus brachyrhynchos]XP_031960347.1 uncharacterized protein LOC116441941 isoform X3 [Corvus moneduloides]XP_041900970.1 uncharacterized protein LOC121672398 isoform X3 [Corvus kubaryi]XP_041900978.1 uncharacterized protein LOC121672401 isoform X3 [Corvus kubaryi]